MLWDVVKFLGFLVFLAAFLIGMTALVAGCKRERLKVLPAEPEVAEYVAEADGNVYDQTRYACARCCAEEIEEPKNLTKIAYCSQHCQMVVKTLFAERQWVSIARNNCAQVVQGFKLECANQK